MGALANPSVFFLPPCFNDLRAISPVMDSLYRIRLFAALVGVFALNLSRAGSVPFWGSHESVPAGTPIESLHKGEFLWMADAVTSGPIVMVVSLEDQKAFVYRNGVLIAATSVSTGRPGHQTPTGVFTVLQKQKEHRSTIYDGAPMPYMQRLTWGGVALHAGGLPGYPESHGCVHLPTEFARQLFGISPSGMTVVIADTRSEPTWVAHPGYLAPVSALGGIPVEGNSSAPQDVDFEPEKSPAGPVSLVLSRQSAQLVIFRNGVEIGQAHVEITGDQPFSTHALVLAEGPSPIADPFVPDAQKYHWLRISVPGRPNEAGGDPDPATIARIHIPRDFNRQVNSILMPGTTLIVTDLAISHATTGSHMQVVDADPPFKAKK